MAPTVSQSKTRLFTCWNLQHDLANIEANIEANIAANTDANTDAPSKIVSDHIKRPGFLISPPTLKASSHMIITADPNLFPAHGVYVLPDMIFSF